MLSLANLDFDFDNFLPCFRSRCFDLVLKYHSDFVLGPVIDFYLHLGLVYGTKYCSQSRSMFLCNLKANLACFHSCFQL